MQDTAWTPATSLTSHLLTATFGDREWNFDIVYLAIIWRRSWFNSDLPPSFGSIINYSNIGLKIPPPDLISNPPSSPQKTPKPTSNHIQTPSLTASCRIVAVVKWIYTVLYGTDICHNHPLHTAMVDRQTINDVNGYWEFEELNHWLMSGQKLVIKLYDYHALQLSGPTTWKHFRTCTLSDWLRCLCWLLALQPPTVNSHPEPLLRPRQCLCLKSKDDWVQFMYSRADHWRGGDKEAGEKAGEEAGSRLGITWEDNLE